MKTENIKPSIFPSFAGIRKLQEVTNLDIQEPYMVTLPTETSNLYLTEAELVLS